MCRFRDVAQEIPAASEDLQALGAIGDYCGAVGGLEPLCWDSTSQAYLGGDRFSWVASIPIGSDAASSAPEDFEGPVGGNGYRLHDRCLPRLGHTHPTQQCTLSCTILIF